MIALVKSKGMACSVYGAQYLLEGLFRAGEADYALSLMTAKSDRGWWNMMHGVGSSMTLEAWNPAAKPNLDWSHAWGTAPLNIIVRWLMGVRPLQAGYSRFLIEPHPGSLTSADLTLPLPQGRLVLSYRNQPGRLVVLKLAIPAGTCAETHMPVPPGGAWTASLDGHPLAAPSRDGYLAVGVLGPGYHRILLAPPGRAVMAAARP